ncbi:calcium-binding protein [Tateyamaria sp. ANG-S1]|uniref:calcium-binding protein n=1 Tax=Tateyamaria sp. ANG-S1 TaxID=1577905 RepID=UPI00068F3BCF|nr:calcium-binding protein [Tateyamaria sp. ANG-S1]
MELALLAALGLVALGFGFANDDDDANVSDAETGESASFPETVIEGTPGGDDIVAGSDAEFIRGLDGNDTIDAGGGDDRVAGGSGADYLIGNDGADTLLGSLSNDTLLGGRGDDVLNGGFGADNIDGGDGDDSIEGGGGADTLFGRNGDDMLDGGAWQDELNGGSGDDTLQGGFGADTLSGGLGDDLLDLGERDAVYRGNFEFADGGEGNDTIFGNEGQYRLIGGAGDDEIHVSGHRDTNGDIASNVSNSVRAGSGEDTVYVRAGESDDMRANVSIRLNDSEEFNGSIEDAADLVVVQNENALISISQFQYGRETDGTRDQIDLTDITGPDGGPITTDDMTLAFFGFENQSFAVTMETGDAGEILRFEFSQTDLGGADPNAPDFSQDVFLRNIFMLA